MTITVLDRVRFGVRRGDPDKGDLVRTTTLTVETRYYAEEEPNAYLVEVVNGPDASGASRRIERWFNTREAALACHGTIVAAYVCTDLERYPL